MPTLALQLAVEDMRRASPAPSLAAEGFALLPHASQTRDFEDLDQLENVYLPEAEALVKSISGAACAWALPRPVLRSEQHGPRSDSAAIKDATAPVAHVDYSAVSIPTLIEAVERRRGERVPPWRRLILYTLWRSLRAPPQDRPLALCDLRTVEGGDLVAADAIANPGALSHAAEFLMLTPNPRHRWCYFPDMVPEEVLIFQQLDSAASGPSGCPHMSFAAPVEAAATRLSIEARVCAMFE